MHTSSRSLACAIITVFAPCICPAAESKSPRTELPTAELRDFLKDAKIEPITFPATSITTATANRQMHACVVKALRESLDAELLELVPAAKRPALVDQLLASWCDVDTFDTRFKVAAEARDLIAPGASAPLAQSIIGELCLLTQDYAEARTRWRVTMDRLQLSGLPALLGMTATEGSISLDQLTNRRDPLLNTRFLDFFEVLIKSDGLGDAEAQVIVHTILNRLKARLREENAELLLSFYQEAKFPEWAKLTLQGACHIDLGWAERGDDVAARVTKAGWEGFAQHLGKAMEALKKSAELYPANPEAASHMIVVAMAGHAGKGVTMRSWFDRAISAQCDHVPSYQRMRAGLRERWGGSLEELISFGVACGLTEKWDTEIPMQFPRALEIAMQETRDWQRLFRHPALAPLLHRVRQEAIARTDDEYKRKTYRGFLAFEYWMAKDYAGAAREFEHLRLPDGKYDIPYGTQQIAQAFGLDARAALRESRVFASKWKDKYLAITDARKAGDTAKALPLAEEILSDPGTEEYTLLRSTAVLTKFERQFDSGEWIPLPFTEGCWTHINGIWKAQGDEFSGGAGNNGWAHTFLNADLGRRFEIRGKIKWPDPRNDQARALFGFAVGRDPESNTKDWSEGWLLTNDRKSGQATLAQRRVIEMGRGRLGEFPDLISDSTEFRAVRDGDQISWWINGKAIAEKVGVATDLRAGAGSFGLITRTIVASNPLSFTNLEARKLKE